MNKKSYIQYLSVIASLGVVLNHSNNSAFWNFSYEKYWLSANVIESFWYFPVCIFFMISGATLMDYRERYTTKAFFKKRAEKTVLPFLVWSILGMLFLALEAGAFQWPGIRVFISNIMRCNYIDLFWFFPCLFSVYLAIPFVSAIGKEDRRKAYGYAICAGAGMNILLPFVCTLIGVEYYTSSWNFPAVTYYMLYVLLGYWIDNYEIEKKWRVVIYVLGVAGLLTQIIGTYFLSYQAGYVVKTFKEMLNVPCLLYSTAIFVCFKYMKKERLMEILEKVTKPFVPMTFGIYLVQWFVLRIAARNPFVPITSIWYRTLGGIVIYLFCALVVKLMQKIPVVKKIVP